MKVNFAFYKRLAILTQVIFTAKSRKGLLKKIAFWKQKSSL